MSIDAKAMGAELAQMVREFFGKSIGPVVERVEVRRARRAGEGWRERGFLVKKASQDL